VELTLFTRARAAERPQPSPALFELPDEQVLERIAARKAELGERLLILGHHYQADEVIRFADYRGDSYKLAKAAAFAAKAEAIVFCGVHFMAESTDILVRPRRPVLLPDLRAGCTMADMADIDDVELAWDEIRECTDARVVPITYINSAASLKAFVGRNGGTVCTSSNARKIITWAFERGEKLLFFPDQHLGRNTCHAMGIPLEEILVWDPAELHGGHEPADIARARVLLWKGHCSVHQGFTVQQIETWRRERPGIQIIVHPECTWEVVQHADASGSTEHILETIAKAPAGSAWAVGTEIHLVTRLKNAHPDKFITSLSPFQCLCSTMYRIRPQYLLWVLDELAAGRVVNAISVPDAIAEPARIALERMLEVTG
jgi:quinolinate synthase